MSCLGRGRGGGQPLQVGQDILVGLEFEPVGSVVCADDGRVVLCTQPSSDMMPCYGVYGLTPLLEGAELSVFAEESLRHLRTHCMGLEGGEYLVGVAEGAEEALVVGGDEVPLGESLHRPCVDDAQHLSEGGRFDLIGDVKAVVNLT